jgi:hypothetical protein
MAVVAGSAPCLASADDDPPVQQRHLFEWGVRAGPGYQSLLASLTSDLKFTDAPNIGFDTYLRIGTDNTRWMNQVSVAFARNVGWSDYQACDDPNCGRMEGIGTSSNGQVALFTQVMFTSGFELNTNPRGEFGFLWEFGFTGGAWIDAHGGPWGSLSGLAGLKIGLGAMLFANWEVTTQFVVGDPLSAQLLVGYNVQWGR